MKYLKIETSWREAMLIPFSPLTKDLLASLSEVVWIEEVTGANGGYKKKDSTPDMKIVDGVQWAPVPVSVPEPTPEVPTMPKINDEDVPF